MESQPLKKQISLVKDSRQNREFDGFIFLGELRIEFYTNEMLRSLSTTQFPNTNMSMLVRR